MDLFQTKTDETQPITILTENTTTTTTTTATTNTTDTITTHTTTANAIATRDSLSREEIVQELKKADDFDIGFLTPEQCLVAMRAMSKLEMTQAECNEFIQLAIEIGENNNGKVGIEEFATHLAFEVKKKKQANTDGAHAETDLFLSNQNSQKLKIQLGMQTHNSNAASTPSPRAEDIVSTPTDPLAALTVPEWYGRSLHSSTAANDGNTKDTWGSSNIELVKKPFISDTPTSNKVSISPINVGLIAPPRSKDQKSPHSSEKKRITPLTRPPSTIFSFAVHFSDGANPMVETPGPRGKVLDEKEEEKDPQFATENILVEPPPEQDTKRPSSSTASNTTSESEKKDADDKAKNKEKDSETQTEAESGKTEEKKKPRTDALPIMKRGTAMLKYGRRGLPHFRRFQVTEDLTRLLWYSHKKNLEDTSIAIADIKEVLEGQRTDVFKQCTQASLERASFSIIYGSKSKTLDLVAKSYEEAKLWSKGLRGLAKAYKQGKLNKVSQIMVNVEYTDITKPNYRSEANPQEVATEYNDVDAVQAVATTLEQSKKTYKVICDLMREPELQKNKEFDSLQETVSELEQRFEDIEFALTHKTIALTNLKRDVWVLKVDVTVLHEKVQVLGKSSFRLF